MLILDPLHILLLANFILIGLLPQIFFRKDGNLNLRWWITALPFYVDGIYLAATLWATDNTVIPRTAEVESWFETTAGLLSAGSIALIAFTLGTHQRALSLWHQDNDVPSSIVTHGAYARIRHPFYSAFILAFVAACLYLPAPLPLVTLIYGLIALFVTARREETRFLASPFGAEYGQYMACTGRFLPRLARNRQ